jgi:hypothetical protein
VESSRLNVKGRGRQFGTANELRGATRRCAGTRLGASNAAVVFSAIFEIFRFHDVVVGFRDGDFAKGAAATQVDVQLVRCHPMSAVQCPVLFPRTPRPEPSNSQLNQPRSKSPILRYEMPASSKHCHQFFAVGLSALNSQVQCDGASNKPRSESTDDGRRWCHFVFRAPLSRRRNIKRPRPTPLLPAHFACEPEIERTILGSLSVPVCRRASNSVSTHAC